jgi:ABC-type antimicrobial peptide transport system permease subunit
VLGANKANAKAVGSVMVQAISPAAMDQAIQKMEAPLREHHRILAGMEDDFLSRNLTEVFEAQETSARVMSILLGGIASISLIVGGIGIMNIMLVSVTERTRGRLLPDAGGGCFAAVAGSHCEVVRTIRPIDAG